MTRYTLIEDMSGPTECSFPAAMNDLELVEKGAAINEKPESDSGEENDSGQGTSPRRSPKWIKRRKVLRYLRFLRCRWFWMFLAVFAILAGTAIMLVAEC
jgi:hypothetical protein